MMYLFSKKMDGLLLSLIENNTVLFFACLFLFLPMIQWHNNSRKEKYLIWPFIKSFSIHCIFGNCEEELPKEPVGRLSADCWSIVGRQVFWGALLHNYRIFHDSHFPHFSFSYYLHTFKYYSSIQALYLYIFLYFFLLDIFTLCIFYTLIFHTLHSLHSTLTCIHSTPH